MAFTSYADNPKTLAQTQETLNKEATAILLKDALKPPTKYVMPAGCVSADSKAVENGKILFNNLNNASGKFGPDTKKLYGNCIACHEIENGEGYGNIGPSLKDYNTNFIKSGARSYEWVYQKIADARIANPETVMTINLTSGLLNEREVCDLMSYVVSQK